MSKITPFLWFDTQAEEAMNFYVSLFKNSRVINVNRAGPDGPVFTVSFELDGQEFMGLNAGPLFKFNEAVSFFIDCEDQAEVDNLWEKLGADGGKPGNCGWIQDKFGLWWQVIPKALGELMGKDQTGKVMEAMLQMHKIDVAMLEKAAGN